MGRYSYLSAAAVLIGGASLLAAALYYSNEDSSLPPLAQPSLPFSSETTPNGSPEDAVQANARRAPPLGKVERVSYNPPVASGQYDLQSRLQAIQQRRPSYSYDAQQVAAAVERTTAWTPVHEAHASLPLAPEDRTDGRQFIELDTLKLDTMMPGDEMWVMLQENGARYRVKIESMETHGPDRVSLHGRLLDLHERYNVTFTRGPSLTVGGLETPEGHYVLQAHGKNGWIASSALLFKNHQDPIVPPPE